MSKLFLSTAQPNTLFFLIYEINKIAPSERTKKIANTTFGIISRTSFIPQKKKNFSGYIAHFRTFNQSAFQKKKKTYEIYSLYMSIGIIYSAFVISSFQK